ncbi:MAG: fatty acid hydroxylase family protein [Comamonadaceae bacterium]|nr:MAG: fatty acid hydroxylase family protein [Comamonadaceae bacterium]
MNYKISKAEYMMDFFVYPLLAIPLAVAASHQPAASALALVATGALGWTLAEYAIHRWLLHGPWAVAREHQAHHEKPAAFIGLSGWYTLLAFAVLFAALRLVAGVKAHPLVLGFMLGYYVYISLHCCFHHLRIAPGGLLYATKVRHVRHHQGLDENFGVTSPLWDKVFRTFR